MYRNALLSKMDGATPEFKYFLLVCLRFEISVIDSRLEIEPLASRLGMGVRTIYGALKYFAKHNLFAVEQVPTRGRMGTRYRRNGVVFERTKGFPEPLMVHQGLVEYILFGHHIGEKSDLRASDRLLLAVLVEYADESGVIRCLGSSEISALTCIGKSAIRGRLERLRDKGLIWVSVPGMNGPYIFQRAKSIHFLDLAHSFYGDAAPSYDVIYRNVDLGLSDLGEMLMRAARHVARADSLKDAKKESSIFSKLRELKLVPYQTVLTQWPEYFIGDPGGGMESYLQAKLDDLAALVLTRVLGGADILALPMDEGLRAKAMNALGFREGTSDSAKKDVINLLLDLSMIIASHIQGFMKEKKEAYINKGVIVAVLPGGKAGQRSIVFGYRTKNGSV